MGAAPSMVLRALGLTAVACWAASCSKDAGTPGAAGAGQSGGGGASSSGGTGTSGGGMPAAGSSQGGGGTTPGGGTAGTAGNASGGSNGGGVTGPSLGAAEFAEGELDPPSLGGTITMQNIGAPGWYPSRRDPASGECDAVQNGECCMTQHELATDQLSPWNEELIMTLRGPLLLKQFVVYQPDPALPDAWSVTSAYDDRAPDSAQGIHFTGNAAFPGYVGSECLIDAMPDAVYPCGPGSVPYCPAGETKYYGWEGSKLFVLLAAMPRVGSPLLAGVTHCGEGTSGNWYDAPWLGLSHGELIRSGAFGSCHCYAKNPDEWWLADGCGQFNVFEVVNDNNEYANFDLFSTNLFAYHGYVGEGPCGQNCDLAGLAGDVDLVNKSTSGAATQGATVTPEMGPGAAFRRPANGYRYFVVLMDVDSRTIQLAVVHPQAIPSGLSGILPQLPLQIDAGAISAALGLRLPQ